MTTRPRLLALPAVAAIAVSGITAPAAQAASTTVVISEVYGGGGNSGAPYQNDFIELGNRSASPVDLTGWKVQYFSATGGTGGTTTLTGTIPAGRTFLIQQAPGAGNGAYPITSPLEGRSSAEMILWLHGAVAERMGKVRARLAAISLSDQTFV